LLLIVVTLGTADILVTRYVAERELQHAQQQMAAQARVLAATGLDRSNLARWASAAAQDTGARVTIIARNGTVLADSQHDSSSMDNHAERPEVRQALAGETGMSVRHSATVDVDLCYLALPTDGVILRLALPLWQISVATAQVRWLILRASLIAAIGAFLIAYFIAYRFTRRIRRIENFATELVNADYSASIGAEADDELGSVARSLRRMAERFREMLRRLADESARRNAILSSMVEGVLAVDSDLRVTFFNEAFARAVNTRTPPAGERLPLLEVVRDPALLELLKQALSAGEPVSRHIAPTSANGRSFDAHAAPLDGQPRRGAIAVLYDVTEIERLERVRKDFVANISHELRTPLAAIRGYAETLLDGALEDPDHARRFLGIICANTVRLGDMASDLLALSEMENELEPPPAERLSVRDIAVAAIEAVRHEAESRNIQTLLCDSEDVHIIGQRFRLEHALLNLLHNAIRYNRTGGDVWVETARNNGNVRISVRDTGFGIPAADLPRIFERFYSVNKARSREQGGTGLGLAIVKHAVEKMSGTVTVESELGKGSVFTLEFPGA
jgi:two-component system phosphate regulon sensor histidine kinase PhoR